jgi:DNA polymerase (family 10)
MQRKPFNNDQIASILYEMGVLCDMLGMDYKTRAYELAAGDVKIYPEQLSDLYQREGIKGLTQVPSVGSGIAKHIEELLTTGHFKEYEEFKKKIPVNLPELLLLEGVGPKTIRELYFRLGIRNLKQLEQACREGKVRTLPRFGVKSEQRILKAILTTKAQRHEGSHDEEERER